MKSPTAMLQMVELVVFLNNFKTTADSIEVLIITGNMSEKFSSEIAENLVRNW